MTNDHAPFIRAVVENPFDDAPRLVYADWLDERGESDRAEFIRAQCELATVPACLVAGQVVNWQSPLKACRVLWPHPQVGKGRGPHCDPCRSFVGLDYRERRLWGLKQTNAWLIEYLRLLPPNILVCIPSNHLATVDNPSLPMVIFRRGFVDEVRCSVEFWLDHATELILASPLTRVRLVDKEPMSERGRTFWMNGQRTWAEPQWAGATLPHRLYVSLPRGSPNTRGAAYRSIEEARYALSVACLSLARDQAGLPAICFLNDNPTSLGQPALAR